MRVKKDERPLHDVEDEDEAAKCLYMTQIDDRKKKKNKKKKKKRRKTQESRGVSLVGSGGWLAGGESEACFFLGRLGPAETTRTIIENS